MLKLLISLSRNTGCQVNYTNLRNESDIDSDITLSKYINLLNRRFIYEPLFPWRTHLRSSVRAVQKEKNYLVDPSLVCAILDIDAKKLLNDLNFFGFLFENLVIKELRIYADLINATVTFFRDSNGNEIDAIVEKNDGSFAVFEIKLGSEERIKEGIVSLLKFESKITEEKYKLLTSLNIITTSTYSYKTVEGVNVISLPSLYFE
jgi:predicted AAA+ superfamily ATPase